MDGRANKAEYWIKEGYRNVESHESQMNDFTSTVGNFSSLLNIMLRVSEKRTRMGARGRESTEQKGC